jgi:hypothetical protein
VTMPGKVDSEEIVIAKRTRLKGWSRFCTDSILR